MLGTICVFSVLIGVWDGSIAVELKISYSCDSIMEVSVSGGFVVLSLFDEDEGEE